MGINRTSLIKLGKYALLGFLFISAISHLLLELGGSPWIFVSFVVGVSVLLIAGLLLYDHVMDHIEARSVGRRPVTLDGKIDEYLEESRKETIRRDM